MDVRGLFFFGQSISKFCKRWVEGRSTVYDSWVIGRLGMGMCRVCLILEFCWDYKGAVGGMKGVNISMPLMLLFFGG